MIVPAANNRPKKRSNNRMDEGPPAPDRCGRDLCGCPGGKRPRPHPADVPAPRVDRRSALGPAGSVALFYVENGAKTAQSRQFWPPPASRVLKNASTGWTLEP